MNFIIRDDEKEVLFFNIFSILVEKTNLEIVYHLDEKSVNEIEKLRKLFERLTVSLDFQEKVTVDEWIAAGMTKFVSMEELEKMVKKGYENVERGANDGSFKNYFNKILFFYNKLNKKQT